MHSIRTTSRYHSNVFHCLADKINLMQRNNHCKWLCALRCQLPDGGEVDGIEMYCQWLMNDFKRNEYFTFLKTWPRKFANQHTNHYTIVQLDVRRTYQKRNVKQNGMQTTHQKQLEEYSVQRVKIKSSNMYAYLTLKNLILVVVSEICTSGDDVQMSVNWNGSVQKSSVNCIYKIH